MAANDQTENGASATDPDRGRTLAFKVYRRMRADIMDGALQPGAPLRSEFLRQRYEVGNSPIREALNRLSAEGFVALEDQKGFQVASVSKTDLIETIETRIKVEEVALRESIEHGDMAWEEAVVLANHRLAAISQSASSDTYAVNPEWEKLHGEFHRTLLSACGSRWLQRFCDQLMDRADRYRRLAFSANYPDRDEVVEHRAITDAVTARKADEAVELLRQHYDWTAQSILETLPAILER